MSGPAVLKLSAWGARELQQRGYQFHIQVNWIGMVNEKRSPAHHGRGTAGHPPQEDRQRLSLGPPPQVLVPPHRKSRHRPRYAVARPRQKRPATNSWTTCSMTSIPSQARTTFKEEFVTCGGVALAEVDFKNHAEPGRTRLVFRRRGIGRGRHHRRLQLSSRMDHRLRCRPTELTSSRCVHPPVISIFFSE